MAKSERAKKYIIVAVILIMPNTKLGSMRYASKTSNCIADIQSNMSLGRPRCLDLLYKHI